MFYFSYLQVKILPSLIDNKYTFEFLLKYSKYSMYISFAFIATIMPKENTH